MEIERDWKASKLYLSQEKHLEKVLDRFNMSNYKPVSTPLTAHFKLSSKSCPNLRSILTKFLVCLILVLLIVSCVLWCSLDLIYFM